jgi:hypothetical protein
MQAELERLKAENEGLKAKRTGKLTFKVSTKGALSVYGLGRFPVTLYSEQWKRLLGQKEAIEAFIVENIATLSVKD